MGIKGLCGDKIDLDYIVRWLKSVDNSSMLFAQIFQIMSAVSKPFWLINTQRRT
jgi:hypothetical protein